MPEGIPDKKGDGTHIAAAYDAGGRCVTDDFKFGRYHLILSDTVHTGCYTST